MRPALVGTLLVLSLATLGIRAQPAPSKRQPGGFRKPAPAATFQTPTWTIYGKWSQTREDAWQDALSQAQTQILAYLRSQSPPIHWTPPVDYVQTHLVKQWWEETNEFEAPVGTMRKLKLELAVTPSDLNDLLQRDREFRAQNRMLFVARILAGMVALLGAVAGYIRVDEWTKGYYTGWLRVVAVGFIAVVGMGLWWIF